MLMVLAIRNNHIGLKMPGCQIVALLKLKLKFWANI